MKIYVAYVCLNNTHYIIWVWWLCVRFFCERHNCRWVGITHIWKKLKIVRRNFGFVRRSLHKKCQIYVCSSFLSTLLKSKFLLLENWNYLSLQKRLKLNETARRKKSIFSSFAKICALETCKHKEKLYFTNITLFIFPTTIYYYLNNNS